MATAGSWPQLEVLELGDGLRLAQEGNPSLKATRSGIRVSAHELSTGASASDGLMQMHVPGGTKPSSHGRVQVPLPTAACVIRADEQVTGAEGRASRALQPVQYQPSMALL